MAWILWYLFIERRNTDQLFTSYQKNEKIEKILRKYNLEVFTIAIIHEDNELKLFMDMVKYKFNITNN